MATNSKIQGTSGTSNTIEIVFDLYIRLSTKT